MLPNSILRHATTRAQADYGPCLRCGNARPHGVAAVVSSARGPRSIRGEACEGVAHETAFGRRSRHRLPGVEGRTAPPELEPAAR